MAESFIILFREGFEAFLILFIVLGALKKTGSFQYNRVVFAGALSAVLGSFILAAIFRAVKLEFEGPAEYLFEGITMITTSLLLAFMILWLVRFKTNAGQIKSELQGHVNNNRSIGIFSLIFFSVFREGLETVLFFIGLDLSADTDVVLGALLGLIAAFGLCYGIFAGTVKLNFRIFFNLTTFILLLIAAGLTARGIHELNEAGIIPSVIEHIWDINPEKNADGSYPALHEKGSIGSFFQALFGYNGNPSLTEVISYVIYLVVIGVIWINFEKKG
jgi:high-affinity iron transporter